MLEKYFTAAHTLARFRSSPAGPHIDGFAVALLKSGYARQTGGSCLRHAVHLGRWADTRGLGIEALDEDAIEAFEAHLGSCSCPCVRAGSHERARARVHVFLGYLREVGVVRPVHRNEQPTDPQALVEFREWMRRHRGVSDWTLRAYSRPIRGLIERLGELPAQYGPQALRRAVLEMAEGYGISQAKQITTATRMFLRYLAVIGGCSPHLADAVPGVAAWSQTTLPKHLPAEEVDKLVASCDCAKLSGLRDRAILLLMARLGLRAGDVVALRLADVDWADGSFRVCGKGRREARLPLPQDVGQAILAYLERGRPRMQSKYVFLTARAPWGPIGSSATISGVVRRAIRRAGVDAPSCGAHLLRHSAATAMLREGASLASIGAILRHRSVETTVQYARVDGRLLSQVAQPWPVEVSPC